MLPLVFIAVTLTVGIPILRLAYKWMLRPLFKLIALPLTIGRKNSERKKTKSKTERKTKEQSQEEIPDKKTEEDEESLRVKQAFNLTQQSGLMHMNEPEGGVLSENFAQFTQHLRSSTLGKMGFDTQIYIDNYSLLDESFKGFRLQYEEVGAPNKARGVYLLYADCLLCSVESASQQLDVILYPPSNRLGGNQTSLEDMSRMTAAYEEIKGRIQDNLIVDELTLMDCATSQDNLQSARTFLNRKIRQEREKKLASSRGKRKSPQRLTT